MATLFACFAVTFWPFLVTIFGSSSTNSSVCALLVRCFGATLKSVSSSSCSSNEESQESPSISDSSKFSFKTLKASSGDAGMLISPTITSTIPSARILPSAPFTPRFGFVSVTFGSVAISSKESSFGSGSTSFSRSSSLVDSFSSDSRSSLRLCNEDCVFLPITNKMNGPTISNASTV